VLEKIYFWKYTVKVGDFSMFLVVDNCFMLGVIPGHPVTLIIRPHRSTTYVDVAYYYKPSSVVCRSVLCMSVGLSRS